MGDIRLLLCIDGSKHGKLFCLLNVSFLQVHSSYARHTDKKSYWSHNAGQKIIIGRIKSSNKKKKYLKFLEPLL